MKFNENKKMKILLKITWEKNCLLNKLVIKTDQIIGSMKIIDKKKT